VTINANAKWRVFGAEKGVKQLYWKNFIRII
jgi:hypothetical protein